MSRIIDELAEKITRDGSVQTYRTVKLLVDKNLQNDSFKAYAYLRWIDDQIDEHLETTLECQRFMKRQQQIIDGAYKNKKLNKLTDEEQIVVELIGDNRINNPRLKSFIVNFVKVIEFDAKRKGKQIGKAKLDWYSDLIAKAVTDGIIHFINHDASYPSAKDQYLAARGAHIAHMLRDMHEDNEEGFINIPQEYLQMHKLEPLDIDHLAYKAWVKDQVQLSRKYFDEGKKYIDQLKDLRVKIAAYWYCARFEPILGTIERDNYRLQPSYIQHKSLKSQLRAMWLAGKVAGGHFLFRAVS